jgi:hypothetical protein
MQFTDCPQRLAQVSARPIEIGTRELVAAAIDAHRVDPELHRVLAEEVPRIGRLENITLSSEALAR